MRTDLGSDYRGQQQAVRTIRDISGRRARTATAAQVEARGASGVSDTAPTAIPDAAFGFVAGIDRVGIGRIG